MHNNPLVKAVLLKHPTGVLPSSVPAQVPGDRGNPDHPTAVLTPSPTNDISLRCQKATGNTTATIRDQEGGIP